MKHRIKQYVDQYHDMLCIELDNESETHLFRHASEITKETKGGYLKGQIIIPNSSKPCYLRLSLVPSEPDLQNNPFHLHPNLLHLNLRQNKKNRNLKMGELPNDVDWSFVFRIDPDGNVSRVSSTSQVRRFFQLQPITDPYFSENLIEKKYEPKHSRNGIYEQNLTSGLLNVPEYSNLSLTKVTGIKEGRYLELGSSGLMLNIITPLKKLSKGGTTINDVVQQRYQDLFHRPMTSSLLKVIEESFTRKETKVKLQSVRLLAEVFDCDPGMSFQKSALSQIIMNSKSKECGPLRLHDLNPAASCHLSRTKVFILSFFKLVSEIKAAFVLWDRTNNVTVNDPILMDLNQPEDCTVFNQTVVICTVPPQKWEVIQAINRLNYELRICAFRPSDNRMSMNAFKFEYLPHVPTEQNAQSFQSLQSSSGYVCGTCHLEKFNTTTEQLPLAKPGLQRRKHDEKKEIPDHLKTKRKACLPLSISNQIIGEHPAVQTFENNHNNNESIQISNMNSNQERTNSFEPGVVDLSMPAPNDKYWSSPIPNQSEVILPKKPRLDYGFM